MNGVDLERSCPEPHHLTERIQEWFRFSLCDHFSSILKQVRVRWGGASESEAMGCTSAKQVSAVPNDEEGRGKAYSNGDLYAGQQPHTHTPHVNKSFTAPLHSVNCSAVTSHPFCSLDILSSLRFRGLWQRVHFPFSNHYCQLQIFIRVVDIDSSCKRGEVTVAHTGELNYSSVFISILLQMVVNASPLGALQISRLQELSSSSLNCHLQSIGDLIPARAAFRACWAGFRSPVLFQIRAKVQTLSNWAALATFFFRMEWK